MNIILLLIGLLNLGLLIYLLQRSDDTRPALREMLEDHEDHLTDQLDYRFEKERQASQIANQQLEIALTDRLTEMRVEIHQQTTALRAEINEHFTKNRDKADERMRQIQESNEVRLEQMRQTVEEKLEKTLQHRLQTSFETVSKQLESVNKGLGEMQTVARDVGTLNDAAPYSFARPRRCWRGHVAEYSVFCTGQDGVPQENTAVSRKYIQSVP